MTAADIVYWYEHEIRYFNLQPKLLRAGAARGRITKVDERRCGSSLGSRIRSSRLVHRDEPDDHTDHILPAHYLRRFHPVLGDR